MKASKVILKIQALIEKHGDIQVGFNNLEFLCYESIGSIKIKKNKRDDDYNGIDNDAKELGAKFIGIDN